MKFEIRFTGAPYGIGESGHKVAGAHTLAAALKRYFELNRQARYYNQLTLWTQGEKIFVDAAQHGQIVFYSQAVFS